MACTDDCVNYAVCWWLRTEPDDRDDSQKANAQNGTGEGIWHVENQKIATEQNVEKVRTYKRRWLMLGLFSIFSMSNSYMRIHLNIISSIVSIYYNESLPEDPLQRYTAIDWLSLVFLLSYVVFIPLGMYILDRRGLRMNNLVGTLVNAAGAWLKCAAAAPDRFALLMASQVVCGVGQIFALSVPPRVAAVWFGPSEVSTATAIGVFSNQLGVAAGFFIPPNVVPYTPSMETTGHNIATLFYAGAGVCSVLFVLMLFVFQGQPLHPPSRAQMLARKSRQHEKYIASMKRLLKLKNFWLIMISYGMNTGSYYALSTVLSSMILPYFPGHEKEVGTISMTLVIAGSVGSIVAGVWLDYSKYFKSTTVVIFLMCTLGMLFFTFTLDQGKLWIVFTAAGILGFFMTGYLPVGYEFAAEITYPEPEGTSAGLLTASAMANGIFITMGMRFMMNKFGIRAANLYVCGSLLLGTILTGMVKAQYKRQEAEKRVVSKVTNAEVQVSTPDTKL